MNPSNRLDLIPDRDLAAHYWAARGELQGLRRPRHAATGARSGEELAFAFQRIRELDDLCERLWRENCRRTQAGSLAGIA